MRMGEPLFIQEGKLVHGRLPVIGGTASLVSDVAQRQPEQLGGGFIAGKVHPRLDDLARLSIDAFDGIGGVDDPAHGWRKRKERDQLLPGQKPGRGNRRMALPHWPCSNASSVACAASTVGAVYTSLRAAATARRSFQLA
jgi:hypothetical protein